jgi:hypothetical protein
VAPAQQQFTKPAGGSAPQPALPPSPSSTFGRWAPPAAPAPVTKAAPAPVATSAPAGKPAAAPAQTFHYHKDLPAPKKSGLQLTAMQAPLAAPADDAQEYTIQLEPPGQERLFRAESEKDLQQRIQQEARQRSTPERVEFPPEPVLSKVAFAGRSFTPSTLKAEPYYVFYDKLYFHEINSERYGWELGVLQPVVSAAAFYKDVILLPYHLAECPCEHFECSAGYCLPGDPVPYLLYPPRLTLTGAGAEAGVIVALAFVFP